MKAEKIIGSLRDLLNVRAMTSIDKDELNSLINTMSENVDTQRTLKEEFKDLEKEFETKIERLKANALNFSLEENPDFKPKSKLKLINN